MPKFISTWLKVDVNFPVSWHTCVFSFLLLGYEPMKGDWVEAKYFINPTRWTTQANFVAPLRFRRLDQVFVSKKGFLALHVSLIRSICIAFPLL